MTANDSSHPVQSGLVSASMTSRPDISAWAESMPVVKADAKNSSRQRLMESRGALMKAEREHIDLAVETEQSMLRQAEEYERRAAQVRAEAWAIEQELQTRITVLQNQARMEEQVANRIKDIAERSALSILDRVKEASDSMMDWADLVGNDLANMMKQEAAEQVSRKVKDIRAVEEAMEDETRAVELLELSARYRKSKAS